MAQDPKQATSKPAKVVGGLAMSLDGYINDKDGSVARLYPDFDALRETDILKESIRDTGAVVMGRRAYEMANGDFTGYEYQAPIFVLTHNPPEAPTKGQNDRLTITFVEDGVKSAVAQAQAAAGDKTVTIVGGASTIRQCIDAELLDELHVDIVSVLLGGGTRMFEARDSVPIEFEQIQGTPYPWFTAMRYRMIKGGAR